jgi:hypothetical protein
MASDILAIEDAAPVLLRCSRTDTTICLNPGTIAVGPKYRKYGTRWLLPVWAGRRGESSAPVRFLIATTPNRLDLPRGLGPSSEKTVASL